MIRTEAVSGRTQLRYRGEPVTHDVTFTPASPPQPGYRDGGTVAECHCGTDTVAWRRVIDGGHTPAELDKVRHQHAGIEDEDET